VLAGVGEGERGVNSGDASAEHQDVGMDGHTTALERLVEGHAAHGGADQVFGLAGSLPLLT